MNNIYLMIINKETSNKYIYNNIKLEDIEHDYLMVVNSENNRSILESLAKVEEYGSFLVLDKEEYNTIKGQN